jgi:hypothetical protein
MSEDDNRSPEPTDSAPVELPTDPALAELPAFETESVLKASDDQIEDKKLEEPDPGVFPTGPEN